MAEGVPEVNPWVALREIGKEYKKAIGDKSTKDILAEIRSR